MTDPKRILFIAQEIAPYTPESNISLTCRYLPQAIQERGKEIRTFMPRFGIINERRNQLHEVIRLSGMNLIIDESDHPLIIKVASIQSARMQIYFIDNDDFFNRKAALFDETTNKHFPDNDERAIFFARGVLETVKKLRWSPDIIHCHGWFSSFAPLFVKYVLNENPLFENTKLVISLYDDEFKTLLDKQLYVKLLKEGVPKSALENIKNKPSYTNILKAAIKVSNAVIAGVENPSEELVNFTVENNIPFLEYQNEDTFVDKFNELYNFLLY